VGFNNEQLQRIYGTMWRMKKDLKAYLTRIEERRNATTASSAYNWIYFIFRKRQRAGFLA